MTDYIVTDAEFASLVEACANLHRKNLTQAQAEMVIAIARQVRSWEEIERDNLEEQRDYDEEKRDGWSVGQ
jgi:hypothetical protein